MCQIPDGYPSLHPDDVATINEVIREMNKAEVENARLNYEHIKPGARLVDMRTNQPVEIINVEYCLGKPTRADVLQISDRQMVYSAQLYMWHPDSNGHVVMHNRYLPHEMAGVV
jgi:hypothetical protein